MSGGCSLVGAGLSLDSSGQEVGAGMLLAHAARPPRPASGGEGQVEALVRDGGVGGVVVLLQSLPEEAVCRKPTLRGRGEEEG